MSFFPELFNLYKLTFYNARTGMFHMKVKNIKIYSSTLYIRKMFEIFKEEPKTITDSARMNNIHLNHKLLY